VHVSLAETRRGRKRRDVGEDSNNSGVGKEKGTFKETRNRKSTSMYSGC